MIKNNPLEIYMLYLSGVHADTQSTILLSHFDHQLDVSTVVPSF